MNHYEILGVGPDAAEQQIKEAYRREAMKWHPDRHDGGAAKGEADRRFKDLAVAYRTLRNPVERANYDRQLEQKLRQEYEARQKEQARQQRPQNEHTQQRQTRPEPPRQDFADTGPQFEEQTASNDYANQMFYEQMLDLALELAGRGFPEFNIVKALIALGCPDMLAKAVAATAAKNVQPDTQKSRQSQSTKSESNPRREDYLNTGTEDEQYYRAALGPNNQAYFLEKFRRFDQAGSAGLSWPSIGQFFGGAFWFFYRRMPLRGLIYIGWPIALVFLISLVFGSTIKDESTISNIYSVITAIAYWTYYPGRLNAIYYKHIRSKVSSAKSHASDMPSQLEYLNKHGGTSSVSGWLALIPIFVGIMAAIALPAYQDYKRRAQVETGYLVGSDAAKKIGDYYAAKKTGPVNLEAAGFSLLPSNTVKNVAFDSQTGVITISFIDSFFDAKSLLLVPTVAEGKVDWLCTSTGIPADHLPQPCKATQSDANARLATINTDANNKAEYDRALAGIEARYPQLNPDSPSYNPAAMEWVAERKKMYDQSGGRTTASSLQQAVTDYANALQQSQNGQQKIQSIPPMDAYISYTRSLPRNVRFQQVFKDMGVKFPMQFGGLSFATAGFRPEHFSQASLLEETQTIAHKGTNTTNNGFILFQNRTNRDLKGIVLEIQSEERSCENKGSVYFMNLELEKVLPPGSVTGVRFTFPPGIPTGSRCMDIVDLIFG